MIREIVLAEQPSTPMEMPVRCASCRATVELNDTHGSFALASRHLGPGLPCVCTDCHRAEVEQAEQGVLVPLENG